MHPAKDETAYALAVSTFSDGSSSLQEVVKRLKLQPEFFSISFLVFRDEQRLNTCVKKAKEEMTVEKNDKQKQ